MSDELPQPRRALKPSEVLELRGLYDLLSDTAAAASDVLASSGSVPSGLHLERFQAIDFQLQDIISRVEAILGAGR